MTSQVRTPFWGRFSVSAKLALLPTIFVVSLVGLTLYTIMTIQGQRAASSIYDVARRQRTLNQLYVKEVLLSLQGISSKESEVNTRKIMMDSADALVSGGQVVWTIGDDETIDIQPAPTSALRANFSEQRNLLSEIVAVGDQIVNGSGLEDANRQLLEKLNKLQNQARKLTEDGVKLLSDYIDDQINGMIVMEVVIGVAISLLVMVISWFIARGITQPLGSVVHLAQNVAKGDLRGDKLSSASNDEIGQLSDTFDSMLSSLKDLTRQVLTATENVNSATTQIAASTQQQATSAKEQSSIVQEITSTMQEIRQSGSQIVDKARQLAAMAEGSATSSQNGIRAVQEASRSMEAIREQVEEVAENIVTLSEKTQAVGEIVATVNEVAEQSNLLALNATIEAVAAGDHGSRFSVVANEMKNLADQAKQCTVQVRSILGDIQKGINSSVMLTEEAVKRVESGKQQADITEETIREMSEATLQSAQAFQQIIGATNQQQIGVEQVTQGMEDIRQSALQTATGTSQLQQAVTSLAALSSQLKTAVGSYRL